MNTAPPSHENRFHLPHCRLLISSYLKLTGRHLNDLTVDDPDLGQKLYESPAVLLSHGTETDPVFNYGNLAAQELFEMDWDTLTRLPSRKSAELPNREERKRLLDEVNRQGFIDNYSGVRISSSGRRFSIRHAVVWNLADDAGVYLGQAATFSEWGYL
ncbi:MAG: MEKHLA domain-containing protein [Endozoicomonas sp.]